MNPPSKRHPLAARSLRPACQAATCDLPFALLSLFLLTIPALQPLLSDSLTCGYDNVFHLWRAMEVETLLRQGVLFSRWAPHMALGYGYPLFNFTAPLSAYPAALLHMLGLSWPWALNLTFALGWLLAAWTMYLFAQDRFGPLAGLVAALLYTYVPFHIYDVLYRGGLAQSSGWLFPPLILWALRRADQRRGLAIAALGFAGLVLTHNGFALLFAPLFGGYLLIVARERGWSPAIWGGLALLFGLGISAFFWMPALAELGAVHSEQVSGAWVFEYANNFLPLEQLLALPRTADPTLLNDWPARGLGLIPALAAAAGFLALRHKEQRLPLLFFATALVLCLLLTLSLSRPLWDHLPLLQQVQFPWRLLGPAALCASILAAAAAHDLACLCPSLPVSLSPYFSFFSSPAHLPTCPLAHYLSFSLLLLSLPHFGWLYPRYCALPADLSMEGMIAWERATDTLGTTALAEFLPRRVERTPQENAPLSGSRLDPAALPEGATVQLLEQRPLGQTLLVETPQPFRAVYRAFDYPGWRVQVDGQVIDPAPSDPEGLLVFDVPAGRHEIVVRFGETPFRLVLDFLSALSLLALAALLIRRSGSSSSPPLSSCPPVSLAALLLAALLLVTLKLGLIDRVDNPLRRANLAGDALRCVDVPAALTFDGQFHLLGYDVLPPQATADQPAAIRLYWQDPLPGGPDYRVTLALLDSTRQSWHDPDLRPSRWQREAPPACLWSPDEYAVTAFDLRPLPGTPPGVYTVTLGVFDRATLTPYAASDAVGQPLGFQVPLGRIELTRPRRPLTGVDAQHDADAAFGPLRLVGYSLDRAEASPGDPFLLTLFWRADETPTEELRVRLRLIDAVGVPHMTLDLPPVRADWPTTLWRAGDLWRGQHAFRLPASLESGPHRWELALYGEGEAPGQPLDLGALQVHAPQRNYAVPPLDVETNARLGEVVTLLGLQLSPATCDPQAGSCELRSTALTVTLVWRAEAEMTTSYRVFLHLLGPDGALLAQSDGEPVNWSRPTTSWVPGEVVLDERVLTVPEGSPAGQYSLEVGMYAWPSLERLPAFRPDGARWPDDRILLTEITLVAAP